MKKTAVMLGWLLTALAAVGAYIEFRSLAASAVVAAVAGMSTSAMAAAGGKAASGSAVHIPAALGALAGAALLVINTSNRPWPERIALTLASYVLAYYGGLSASEQWGLGPGLVAVSGAACARLGAAALDTAHRLVRDADWVKSMLARRPGGKGGQ